MLKRLTEFKCLQEAAKLYTGRLTLQKAIDFLKFENDWDIEIIEDDYKNINVGFCEENDINVEHMVFMKKLQESGEINMITESIPVIMKILLLDKKEARRVLSDYIAYYDEVYNPQKCI